MNGAARAQTDATAICLTDETDLDGGRLAQDGVAAFAVVLDELKHLRSLHKAIGDHLRSYADLAAGGEAREEGNSGVDGLLAGLDALSEALRGVLSGLSGTERREHVLAARTYLNAIEQDGRSLKSVATLTRTTAASLGVTTLSGYLEALSETAQSIGSSARDVCSLLDQLEGREAGILDRSRDTADALSVLASRLRAEKKALESLAASERQLAERIVGKAGALSAEGKGHLKGLVTAMQFSDRFAQRLEHFAAMTKSDDGHLAHLAAAQAKGIVSDLESTAESVRTCMEGMSRLGRDGAALFTEGAIVEAITQLVTSRTEILAPIVEDLAEAEAVIGALTKEAQHAAECAEAAQESFKSLETSCKAVSIASINSMLLSRQSGSTRGSLSFLSNEVRDTAVRCLAALGGSQASLRSALSQTEEAHTPLISASQVLDDAVSRFQTETEADRARLEDVRKLGREAGTAADELVAIVGHVDVAMAAVTEVGQRLGAAATALSAKPATGAPDPELLAEFWDSYTMDDERLIHAEVFAGVAGAEAPQAETPSDEDDVGDLLF